MSQVLMLEVKARRMECFSIPSLQQHLAQFKELLEQE